MRWKIELAAVAIVLFGIALFFAPRQDMLSITGFYSTQTQRQQVNIEITQSTSYLLQNIVDAPLSLSHFSISGSIIGTGAVEVFLKDSTGRVLVYSNVHKKKTGLKGITGNFIGLPNEDNEQGEYVEILQGDYIQETPTVPEGYETSEESFKESCLESCALPVEYYHNAGYTLEFLVTPGTRLKLDEIIFIVAEN